MKRFTDFSITFKSLLFTLITIVFTTIVFKVGNSVSTKNCLCTTPYDLGTTYTNNKVFFTWKEIEDDAIYQVEWYTDEDSTTILTTVFTTKISFDLGMTRGNIHCRVRAVCNTAFSTWSYTYRVKIS